LVLLFVLAIAAIPGALLPQRRVNEQNVIDYIANNGRIAEIYDQLGLFDIFESTLFTAIFVLLTISLIGCILPRSFDHYKAMKTPPGRAPKGTVAKLAMRQPFVLFKGLTFQKLCLPGAFRPGDHHNKMLRPGLCVVHASPQYL